MRDDVGMSSDVAEGGTAREGKGVHTDTVSDDFGRRSDRAGLSEELGIIEYSWIIQELRNACRLTGLSHKVGLSLNTANCDNQVQTGDIA